MNSILGISLGNIVVEKGEEHDRITAEIFIDNNKAGEIINDGWCDEFYIEFLDISFENEFELRRNKYYKKKKIDPENYDVFIRELLFVSKEYKTIKNSQLNCEQLTFLWK